MQFGVCLPNFSRLGTREIVVDVARQAEALGYDSVWTTDHVIMQKGQEEPYGHILEALTTLAYVAALTQRVRLGVSVLVFPQRNAVLVAKETATLDDLSGGRLILGVGAGWNAPEFRFLGADFERRGQRLDEYIQALRELWTAPEPRFAGRFVQFSDVLFSPRPAQLGGPPIWLGGGSPAALRRVARLCDGWHPVGITPEQFAAGMQRIRELGPSRAIVGSIRLRVGVERDLPEVRGGDGRLQATLGGTVEAIIARLREYQAAGVSHVVCYFGNDSREAYLEDMRRFAEEVVPSLR